MMSIEYGRIGRNIGQKRADRTQTILAGVGLCFNNNGDDKSLVVVMVRWPLSWLWQRWLWRSGTAKSGVDGAGVFLSLH